MVSRFRWSLVFALLLSSHAPAAPFAYISSFEDNNVAVIDVAQNIVVATIPVGTAPVGAAFAQDGSRA